MEKPDQLRELLRKQPALNARISLAQVLGMTAPGVFNAYVKKNGVNFTHQESGHATQDEHDSRHT